MELQSSGTDYFWRKLPCKWNGAVAGEEFKRGSALVCYNKHCSSIIFVIICRLQDTFSSTIKFVMKQKQYFSLRVCKVCLLVWKVCEINMGCRWVSVGCLSDTFLVSVNVVPVFKFWNLEVGIAFIKNISY